MKIAFSSKIKQFPKGLNVDASAKANRPHYIPRYFTPRRNQIRLLVIPDAGLVKNFKTASSKDNLIKNLQYVSWWLTSINNKFKEGNKNANLFSLLVFVCFYFKLIPEEPKPWKHNSLLSENIWLETLFFRKTQDCQWNYAEQLNNYHTFQNEHSTKYISNWIFLKGASCNNTLFFSIKEIIFHIK